MAILEQRLSRLQTEEREPSYGWDRGSGFSCSLRYVPGERGPRRCHCDAEISKMINKIDAGAIQSPAVVFR